MILDAELVDPNRFFRLGQAAQRGVALVSWGTAEVARERTSGWLVTPRLLLTTMFGRQEVSGLSMRFGKGTPEGRFLWRGKAGATLVRLARARSSPLTLAFDPPPPNSWAAVMGYREGETLAFSMGRMRSPRDRVPATPLFQHPVGWYTASTTPGMSGGPVFGRDWRVIGMHVGNAPASRLNYFLPTSAILSELRGSPVWDEVAAFHGLVTPVMVPVTQTEHAIDLRRAAAVRSTFNPDLLGPTARAELAGDVLDPEEPTWMLRQEVRTRALRTAGGLEALRAARGDTPATDDSQRIIDRVLRGPPFPVEAIADADLARWIPVAGWFAGLVPDLPTGKDLQLELERRKHEGRLREIVGDRFVGRDEELRRMHDWGVSGTGPLVVAGPGGIGKSALLARFVLERPPGTLFAWLDFDRADLAADDEASILSELVRQLTLQVPALGAASDVATLKAALGPRADEPILVVLDSFEVAQHAGRYSALWPVLEELAAALPALRVLTGSRARVPTLALRGQEARTETLKGLPLRAAEAWLAAEGLPEDVVGPLAVVARGVPVCLNMVRDLVLGGEDLESTIATVPEHLVQGWLYRRILGRLRTPALRPIAAWVLVLRRVSAEQFADLFPELLGFPAGDAARHFTNLCEEVTLLAASDPPEFNHDLRHSLLPLLDAEDAGRVRAIDAAAVDWYAALPRSPENAAELVYHRLRCDDLQGAADAWVRGCGVHIGELAVDEVPPDARAWLTTRLAHEGPELTDAAWDADAAPRLRDALGRSNWTMMDGILGERTTRMPGGVVQFLEAVGHWRRGNLAEARRIADRPPNDTSDLRLLRAALAEAASEVDLAGRILAPEKGYSGMLRPLVERLAIHAAQLRFTIRLPLEEAFLARVLEDPAVSVLLTPEDVVLPALRQALPGSFRSPRFDVELSAQVPPELWGWVTQYNTAGKLTASGLLRAAATGADTASLQHLLTDSSQRPIPPAVVALALRLTGLSLERHRLVRARHELLDDMHSRLLQELASTDPVLDRSIVAAAVALSVDDLSSVRPEFLSIVHRVGIEPHPTEGWEPAARILESLFLKRSELSSEALTAAARHGGVASLLIELIGYEHPEWLATILHALTPSPLPRLIERRL